jgi:hypothetical protein
LAVDWLPLAVDWLPLAVDWLPVPDALVQFGDDAPEVLTC